MAMVAIQMTDWKRKIISILGRYPPAWYITSHHSSLKATPSENDKLPDLVAFQKISIDGKWRYVLRLEQ